MMVVFIMLNYQLIIKKNFKALGGLPYRQKLKVAYNGKSAIAKKADIGAGGKNHPKIDLHKTLSDYLGFTKKGLGYVTIEKV